MAKKLNTLKTRVILGGLAIHAVLLPLVFFGMIYVLKDSHEAHFIDEARKYSHFLAEHLESTIAEETFESRLVTDIKKNYPKLARQYSLSNLDMTKQNIRRLLDSAVLGSDSVFAEFIDGQEYITSGFSIEPHQDHFLEDFSFGENGDNIYYLSIPLIYHNKQYTLRMGFDELPVLKQLAIARNRLVIILVIYFIVSMVALIIVSSWLTRPLKRLQETSRTIANGEVGKRIQVDSGFREITGLAADLESMRFELVNTSETLKREIQLRKDMDIKRQSLESKLRQAQKMESIGVLVGGISHEFNNILLPIVLYTQQAQIELEPQHPVQKHLERIIQSATRAKRLVDQILTFSRQSGDQIFKAENITTTVEEALELLRALMPSNIELKTELNANGCQVWAVRDQIHQIVMNLGSNAYLAIEHSNGVIKVILDCCYIDNEDQLPKLKKGQYVRLSFQDNGKGIDRFSLERVFEPFYTTRSVGSGTGLGLSVVHGIVSSHHGEISVNSEQGKGTTIEVFLPVYHVNSTLQKIEVCP